MEKKICLLGTAPSSMMLAPFGNPEWEIWSCSPGTYGAPRIDRFFELHRWEKAEWFSDGYIAFLQAFEGPIYMGQIVDEVPNSVPLPWEMLVQKYGPYFFTSSLAWMLAMAIEEGATKIALYGVDMAATTEYENQRLGCQFFAALATAMGIEVGVPPESDLFRPAPLYGICEWSHVWAKQRIRAMELNRRREEAQENINTKTKELAFIQGAMDDQDYQLHSWFGGPDTMGRQFTSTPAIPALIKTPLVSKLNGEAEVDVNLTPPPKKKTRRSRKSV